MITVDMGRVEINGMKLLVKAEFTTLIHSLVKDTSFTKDDIRDCVKLAFMSESEPDDEIARNRVKVTDAKIDNAKIDNAKIDDMMDDIRRLLLGELGE